MTKAALVSGFLEEDSDVVRFEDAGHFDSPYPQRPTPAVNGFHEEPSAAESGDLKRKQEELLRLRHALLEKERETNHLELRKEREERFNTGRREMCEKFARWQVRLERELYNAQKAIEEITVAKDLFDRHQNLLRGMQPESWQRSHIDSELDNALGAVEDAEDEFTKTTRRLSSVLPSDPQPVAAAPAVTHAQHQSALTDDFKHNMRRGLAFTLPLGVMVMSAIILARILFH